MAINQSAGIGSTLWSYKEVLTHLETVKFYFFN